jgi:hypothetical protein
MGIFMHAVQLTNALIGWNNYAKKGNDMSEEKALMAGKLLLQMQENSIMSLQTQVAELTRKF